MGRGRVSRGRLVAVLRGLRLDRNPLRRTSDRIETVALALLVAAFAAGTTLAVLAGARSAAAAGQRTARAQAGWHQAGAVVLGSAPRTAHAKFQAAPDPRVRARWTVAGGASRAGEIYLPPGTPAGSTVPVWVDRLGRLVQAPVQGTDLMIRAALQGLLAVSLLAAGLAGLGWAVRRLLNRWRLAAWDLGWSATGPQWTGRR